MKYPKDLECKLPEIKEIVKSWPFDKKIDEVMAWIMQFEKEDYDIAIRTLRCLNVIGSDELNSALSVAYSKLLRHAREKGYKINHENTLYMPIGNDGKSGAMIAYNFRLINGLNSAYFLSKDTLDFVKQGKIDNLVMIDDIIATGNQSSSQLVEIASKARSVGIQNIFMMTAFGYKQGIEKLRDTEVADVFSAIEYDEDDTVTDLDSTFYEGLTHAKRIRYLESIQKNYGHYGYGGIGGFLVFYYNTPNSTLPMVWYSKEGWLPLFARKFDLKNIGPEVYELEELIKEKEGKEVVAKEECSIYVEGKTEELFLQILASRYNNFGYGSLNIVSIGPFYSGSLIASLKKYSQRVYFVTAEKMEENSGHTKGVLEAMQDEMPDQMNQVMSYFDIGKIKSTERFSRILDMEIIEDATNVNEVYRYLENKLIKKAASVFKIENMIELIDNCSKLDEIKELASKFQKEESEE